MFLFIFIILSSSAFAWSTSNMGNVNARGWINTTNVTSDNVTVSELKVLQAPVPCSSGFFMSYWNGSHSICPNANGTLNSLSWNYTPGIVSTLGTKVGIGTPTPNNKLEVRADGSNDGFSISDANVEHGIITFYNTNDFGIFKYVASGQGGLDITGLSDTDLTALKFTGVMGTDNPTDSTPTIRFSAWKKDGNSIQVLGDDETTHQFLNGNSAKMTILGSGNVGIGTTSPSHKLHVVGDENLTGALYLSKGRNIRSLAQGIIFTIESGASFVLGDDSVTAKNCFKFDTGRDAVFCVNDTASLIDAYFIFSKETRFPQISFGDASGVATTTEIQNNVSIGYLNGDMILNTTDGDILLNPLGNVGIGTDIPSGKLEVSLKAQEKFIITDGDDNDNVRIEFVTNVVGQPLIKMFNNEEVEMFRLAGTPAQSSFFNNGGNVGIGTTSPDEKLTIEGGIVKINDTDSITAFGSSYFQVNRSAQHVTVLKGCGSLGCFNQSYDSSALILSYKGTGFALDPNFAIRMGLSQANRIEASTNSNSIIIYNTGATDGNTTFETDLVHIRASSGKDGNLVVDGNVGIGTLTPTEKLEVFGDIKTLNGVVRINSSGGSTGFVVTRLGGINFSFVAGTGTTNILTDSNFAIRKTTSAKIIAPTSSDSTTMLFIDKDTGNVGLGFNNTNPTATLDVNGSVAYEINRTSVDIILGIDDNTILANASDGNVTVTLPSPDNIEGTKYTVKLIQGNSSYNVMINTTLKTEKIDNDNNVTILVEMSSLDFIAEGGNWWIT